MHEGISVHSIDNLTNANSNPQNLLIRFVENTHHTVAVCTMYDSVCKASTNWATLCIIRRYFYRRITHTITPSFNRVSTTARLVISRIPRTPTFQSVLLHHEHGTLDIFILCERMPIRYRNDGYA